MLRSGDLPLVLRRHGFFGYPLYMKNETLSRANPYLKDAVKARRNRVRSLASSTAIETGEPISVIEEKLDRKPVGRSRVTLA